MATDDLIDLDEELSDALDDLLGSVSSTKALEETIGSDPALSTPRNAAVVALCRVLARQMDLAGVEVSSRVTAAYLSALKDLRKAMDEPPVKKPAKPGEEASLDGGKSTSGLASIRSNVVQIKAGHSA